MCRASGCWPRASCAPPAQSSRRSASQIRHILVPAPLLSLSPHGPPPAPCAVRRLAPSLTLTRRPSPLQAADDSSSGSTAAVRDELPSPWLASACAGIGNPALLNRVTIPPCSSAPRFLLLSPPLLTPPPSPPSTPPPGRRLSSHRAAPSRRPPVAGSAVNKDVSRKCLGSVYRRPPVAGSAAIGLPALCRGWHVSGAAARQLSAGAPRTTPTDARQWALLAPRIYGRSPGFATPHVFNPRPSTQLAPVAARPSASRFLFSQPSFFFVGAARPASRRRGRRQRAACSFPSTNQ